jgi:hypothetical protein
VKGAALLCCGFVYVAAMAFPVSLGVVATAMFAAGIALGAATVGAAHAVDSGAFRWRVRVRSDGYSPRVTIEGRRLWHKVELDKVTTGGDDFDERLHVAVAKAGVKVAALNAQRRLGR